VLDDGWSLLDIFYRAMEIEARTPHLYEETRVWFRFNESQRRAHRDGLSIAQLGTDGLKRRLFEWALRNGNPRQWFSPRSIGSFLKTYCKGIDSARGLVLLKTRTNRQPDWPEVGRGFARVTLALTQLGLTSHPYSQILQEFPGNGQPASRVQPTARSSRAGEDPDGGQGR
jgi:hypothetical protein